MSPEPLLWGAYKPVCEDCDLKLSRISYEIGGR